MNDKENSEDAAGGDAPGSLPTSSRWKSIETVPEGVPVLLYWPVGEKGVGGVEAALVYRNDSKTGFSYWTHGGPNAGDDWDPRNDERPTLWCLIQYPAGSDAEAYWREALNGS